MSPLGAQPATVSVFFESNPAGSETISDGKWSIEVDQPGSYTFLFQAAFPYARHDGLEGGDGMKVNALQAHREAAELTVNGSFYPTSLDLVHAAKKTLAQYERVSAEFTEAAEIEGVSAVELRRLILSKPDDILVKDNKRRRLIVAIRNATSVAEIDQILTSAGLPTRRDPVIGVKS